MKIGEFDMENENQKVEQFWDTPTHDQIVEISHAHVEALEASNDDNVWQQVGMHHIILTTIGRRSGKEHKCALPIWCDLDGHRVVVGSFAGADKEPDWLANLRDRDSNSEVKIRTQIGFIERSLFTFPFGRPTWEITMILEFFFSRNSIIGRILLILV